MVSLLQTGRFVVVRFIARYNITELKNQYSYSLRYKNTTNNEPPSVNIKIPSKRVYQQKSEFFIFHISIIHQIPISMPKKI